ncbi:MAG: hypothetical protein QY317_14120 [Candidatus Jettenia caeni]|nr:MAG: hypothetical protein QY317_14120 [Candidatus Jettenia caeni]
MSKQTRTNLREENIICFAGADWWYHNPHSDLHIMKSFAKQNRILFVNSIGTRMPSFKTDKFAWKRIIGKLKSLARYLKKAEQNIYVLTPIALPPIKGYERFVSIMNKCLLLLQFDIILRMLNFKNPLLWVCIPSVKDIALYQRRKIAKCLVYYCTDNVAYYTGEINHYILDMDIRIQQSADVAFFVNHRMVEERKNFNHNTHHLGHGVDYDHFARCNLNHLPVPDDIMDIKTPIVGYIGVLTDLDFELVRYLARKNKDLSFVFIGDIYSDTTVVKEEKNIYFLGKKPYELLPNYMQKIACFGIYYRKDNIFNSYRNPKKLLEYLATGKPVVSVDILELEYFKDYLYIAKDYEEFNYQLHRAISSDTPAMRQKRTCYAKEHTWDFIADQAAQHIVSFLNR